MVKKFILLVCLVFLFTCEQTPRNSIRFGIQSPPVTLDPRFDTGATSTRINRLLYQQLVEFDERYLPVPSLARWKKLHAKHYRFHIIGENYFQDGDLLTAEDVKASYDYVRDKTNASPHGGSFSVIDKIIVVDKRTIDFILNKADGFFPAYLVLGIVQKKYIDQGISFSRRPQGSGAFDFVAWKQSHLVLKRRSDGQVVEFHWVKDPVVRILKLIRGEIDIIQNEIPQEYENYLKKQKQLVIQRNPGTNFAYLGFNMEDSSTAKRSLRLAIAHGINRKEIIKYLWGKRARLAESILSPQHWAGTNLPSYPFDPAKAKTIIAKNFSVKPKITYKTSSAPFSIRLASIIQFQLKQVGIDVDIRSYDWGTFYSDIKSGNFQMYSLQWVGIKSPDIYKYIFHSNSIPPKGANRGRYSNASVDKLLEKVENTESLEEQAEIYENIQQKIHTDLPFIPLWYENHFFAAQNNIKNYQLSKDGNYDGLKHIQRLSTQ